MSLALAALAVVHLVGQPVPVDIEEGQRIPEPPAIIADAPIESIVSSVDDEGVQTSLVAYRNGVEITLAREPGEPSYIVKIIDQRRSA